MFNWFSRLATKRMKAAARQPRFTQLHLEQLEDRLAPSTTPINGEFRVNAYTTSNQAPAKVAMDSAGDYVVVWASNGQDGSGYGVYARVYNAAGAPQTGEIKVNTATTNDQKRPSVAMDSAGDFVVAWDSDQVSANGYDIYFQRYNLAGTAQGGETRANTYTTSNQVNASVALDAVGDFVIAWQSPNQVSGSSGYDIYAQRYNLSGVAQNGPFQVNTYTTNVQANSSVGMDAAGDFVIAWSDYAGEDGNGKGIYAQRYSALGVTRGSEFKVNNYTTSGQAHPNVALDAAGDFVVVWQSYGQDGSGYGVYAQRYSIAGIAEGNEFRVNTATNNNQTSPSVALDAAGDFLVAWDSFNQDGNGYGVFAQRFNGNGTLQAGEFQVNSTTTNTQIRPAVAMDAAGDFVVAWQSNQVTANGYDIFAQQYHGDRPPQGAVTSVSLYPNAAPLNLNLAADFSDPDPGDTSPTYSLVGNSNPGLLGTVLNGATLTLSPAFNQMGAAVVTVQASDAFGATTSSTFSVTIEPAGETRVNTYTTGNQFNPSVAMDAVGDYVAIWTSYGQDGSGYGVYAQRYNASGVALGSEFRVNTYTIGNQRSSRVAMDAGGDFVVAWQSYGQDGGGYGVYAQRYNAAGIAQGGEFRVNSYTTGNQEAPSVALDTAGDFVVAWMSYGQDGSNYGIYAQRYNAAGIAQGGEFRVNSYTTNAQAYPSVAMDAAGDIVIAWQSQNQVSGSSGYDIYAQRYNLSGVAQNGPFQVNTFTANNQYYPRVALDAAGDFVVVWMSFGQDGSNFGIDAQRYNPAGVPQGGEFRVNSYTTDLQTFPTVAMDAAGDFVVAWESYLQDGSGYGVYAQRYSPAGAPQGGEFRVNSYTTSYQTFPSVALDAAGDFVVAWESFGQDGSGYGVYAQVYNVTDPTLAPGAQGGEFRVNSYTTNSQTTVRIASDAAGDLVAVWQSYGQDGFDYGVYAQRYNPAGIAQGGEFRVNSYTTYNQFHPSVAMDAAGDFIVAWESYGQDGSGYGIFAQRFNAAGLPRGGEFRVNSYTTSYQAYPSVALDAAGDFVVAWESYGQDGSDYGIFAQRYNAAGVTQGSEFRVNSYTTADQRFPRVAMDAAGDFVVAWQSYGQDGSRWGIYAQRYNPAGVPQGSEFRVNSYSTNSQENPSVALDAAGDFVVAWDSYLQDGSGSGIYSQRYNAAGAPQGSEFRVNSYTTGNQEFPSVALDAPGDFVVAWQNYGQDGSHYGIYAQRYNPAGAPQGSEFRVNSYTTNSQENPSVALDAAGDFVVAWSSYGQDGSGYGVYAQRYARVNQAPSIISNGGGSVAFITVPENTTAVTTVQAGDPDAHQVHSFTIVGGADASKFQINPDTGALTFSIPPDYENPTDGGLNNLYYVTVQAVDSFGYLATQADNVAVTQAPAETVYVNATWSGLSYGTAITDADPTTPGNQPAVFGVTAYANVASAETSLAASGGTIALNAGSYSDSINLSKSFTLVVLGNATLGGAITGSQSLNMSGPATLTLTGTDNYAGGTTINSGTLQIGSGGTLGSITGNVADNGTLTFNHSDNPVFSGVISGSGSVVKNGTGSLTLNAANSYAGGTTANRGTLLVGADSQLGLFGGPVTANAPGKLIFTANTMTGRQYVLGGATLQINSGVTLTIGSEVDGGFLIGPGTISTVSGGGSTATFNGTSALTSITIGSNGSDQFNSFSNGGQFIQAAGVTATLAGFTNSGSGVMTINGGANVSDFLSYGQATLNSPAIFTNVGGTDLNFAGGSVTTINLGTTLNIGTSASALVAGGLVKNYGTFGSSSQNVVVDYQGRVQGPGTFYSVVTQNGGTYSPGNSPGPATHTIFNVNGGGIFDFEVANAAGTAGTFNGWDMATVQPTIFNPSAAQILLTATPANPYTIQIDTKLNSGTGDVSGMMDNFNPAQNYSWKFLDGSNANTTVAGAFNSNEFNIITTGVVNSFTGTFSVALRDSGQNFYIVYTPASVGAPAVAGIVVNGGQSDLVQRSMITNVQVTFNSVVTLGATAFSFSGTSPSGAALTLGSSNIAVATQTVGGVTVATLTFQNDGSNGHNTEGGNGVFSLGDGVWDLHILASQVSNGGGTMSVNYDSIAASVAINRLYGDINGIGQVDPSSFNAFSAAYLSSLGASNYVPAFDVFNIGQIDPSTFNRFAQNYGLSV